MPSSTVNGAKISSEPSIVPSPNLVPVAVAQSPNPSPQSLLPQREPLARMDSDLLQVIQRLEESINTLDVNARICLRDALISLSNKASNPSVQPTPEQEAMIRAAEYLVLRMLFHSEQVVHVPPGTGGSFAETPVFPSSSSSAARHDVNYSQSQAGMMGGVDVLRDDGTVAASTGNVNVSVAQPRSNAESNVDNNIDMVDAQSDDDKQIDGT